MDQLYMDGWKCPSPVTGVVQVLTVAAAGRHMAALPQSVHILAAAQRLLLLQMLFTTLLHDGQPYSLKKPTLEPLSTVVL